MSFWDRIAKRPPPAPEPARETSRGEARSDVSEPLELTRLRRLEAADGPSAAEAASLFRALRASPHEGRAIDAVRAIDAARPIPEALRVAVSAALAERGDPSSALLFLAPPGALQSSPEGRLLAADLHADRGELPEALALVERVLVVDFDYPGARERHARWRSQLGLDPSPARTHDRSAATLVAREPDAPFTLLREVARGGAGAVYEAEDRELGRRVALKVYHHPDRDRAQLLHEARVAASLASRGIVRVLDADPERGWLALDWAPFGSLRVHVRAGDATFLEPIERWAIPLASALARVHAAGWVHHDVKPSNVLLAAADRPLLADFGTARRVGEASPPGSLGYVSPERLGGRASDPRDDVFGFGRILEDALGALPSAPPKWREIAAACTGPDASRPTDARPLLTRLRVETR